MNDINKVCSCPSGEGSLRHPCPAHPNLAEAQPGGRTVLVDISARGYPIAWMWELADGSATQFTRCGEVAGEAASWGRIVTPLYAQPGGRVRLGDKAERAPWRSMDTCPRDGTVVRLRWGEDHVSPGWWSAPVSPAQNDDGTWPSDTGGFPWAFIDFNNGSAFVNHAVDTEYGPTHWAPYAALSAKPSPGGQGDARETFSQWWARQSDDIANLYAYEIARLGWDGALAARQPVGQEPAAAYQLRKDAQHNGFEDDHWEPVSRQEYEATKRVMGGHGPKTIAGMVERGDLRIDDGGWMVELRELYAAPPAQTVDLGPAMIPDTPEVRDILGRPNFWCSPWANVLRMRGDEIPNKAEEEQAAVIRFMLNHYLARGADWAETAGAELDAIRKSDNQAVGK